MEETTAVGEEPVRARTKAVAAMNKEVIGQPLGRPGFSTVNAGVRSPNRDSSGVY